LSISQKSHMEETFLRQWWLLLLLLAVFL